MREQLHQRWLRALGQLVALQERDGDYAAAIGVARRIIRHDALDEAAYRRLMRLLARSGDRAGALRVYHTCATALQRELGIAPSAETRDGYERLLHGEDAGREADVGGASTADDPAAARKEPLSALPTLIGRRREQERLFDAWRLACAQGPGVALVTGEAGIGKSPLAEEVLGWARPPGATPPNAHFYAPHAPLSLPPATHALP